MKYMSFMSHYVIKLLAQCSWYITAQK